MSAASNLDTGPATSSFVSESSFYDTSSIRLSSKFPKKLIFLLLKSEKIKITILQY
jgi:hypothetical protein